MTEDDKWVEFWVAAGKRRLQIIDHLAAMPSHEAAAKALGGLGSVTSSLRLAQSLRRLRELRLDAAQLLLERGDRRLAGECLWAADHAKAQLDTELRAVDRILDEVARYTIRIEE